MKNKKLMNISSFPFDYYLDQITNLLIIIFNKNYLISNCNQTFLKITGQSQNDLKQNNHLENYLINTKINDLLLPKTNKFKEQILQFKDVRINIFKAKSYIFKVNTDYILIGQQEKSNKNLMEEVTRLNNELTNKSRQLTKKNIKLKKQKEKIKKLLRTDDLTNLNNRRSFNQFYDTLFSISQRYNDALSLIMFDLDNFKHFNDQYGHQAGDDLLKEIGKLLNKNTRKEDIAARIGGEEFYILLPNTKKQKSKNIAERLRRKISEISLDCISETATASFGVVELKQDESQDDFLIRVDTALYQAKNKGKNRIEVL